MLSVTAQIRLATAADVVGIAQVHVVSSTEAFAALAGRWPSLDIGTRAEQWKQWLSERPVQSTRFELLALVDSQVVGFISAGPSKRQALGADCEVFVIHVLPEWRGKGIGLELFRSAANRARGPELSCMCLHTLEELACCRFYEAQGGQVVERAAEDFFGAERVGLTYLWPQGVRHCAE
jgi:GNAT superfamily N-acetyltransferase